MEESVILKWLKRIFSLQTLSILGTLGGIYFGITQFRHDTGGDLNASYNTELLRNNEYRDLIVFTDSKEFSINNLCPNFNNTDKYTLKDFNLQHTVETQNIQVFKTDFFTSFKLSDNTSALKYYDNSLSPHQSAENPISKIIMDSQKGSCLITSRATWDGADKPFIFKANINFTHIPHTPNESFENWKRKCKEYTAENPLYVVALGASTNVSSALVMDPTLKERITVVWLGGHSIHCDNNAEFNLRQDVAGARVLFGCGVPLVILPCKEVVQAFTLRGP